MSGRARIGGAGPALAGTLVAAALAAAGCGGEHRQHEGELRPPLPLVLSAAITPTGVEVSPAAVGAGPVTVVVANLTGRAQQVTLERAGTASPLRGEPTASIEPRDTATLEADVEPGGYRLRVGSGAIAPAAIAIGPPRASAQDELMLP